MNGASEWYAGGEHLLYQWRRRNPLLDLQVEDPLQPLHAQGPERGQAVEDPGEVLLLLLRVRVVRHVVLQRVDHLVLQVLHLLRVGQAVPF